MNYLTSQRDRTAKDAIYPLEHSISIVYLVAEVMFSVHASGFDLNDMFPFSI